MDDRREFEKIVYNILYKLLNVLFPLVSAGIIARRLLPVGVGQVSAAQNIVTYFTFLAPIGLPFYGIRETAKVEGEKLNKLFSECWLINAMSTSVCVCIYYFMVNLLPYFGDQRLLYNVAGLSIIFNYLNVEWLYQGKGNYKYIAVRSMGIKCAMFFAIIILIRTPDDYIKYAMLYCLATGGNYLFNIIRLKKYHIKLQLHDVELRWHIMPLLALLASNIAVELYSLVDTTMLSVFCSKEIVAYYTNSMKVVKVAIFVIAAIGGTTLQRISPLIEKEDFTQVEEVFVKMIRAMLFFAIPCMLGVICLAPQITFVLYGPLYENGALTMRILAGLFLVLPFSNFIGTQILVALKKESEIVVSQIVAAVVNIVLNMILIRSLQQNGAAIASVISEAVVLICMLYFVKKKIHWKTGYKYILQLVLSGLAMSGVIIGISLAVPSHLICLILSVIVGGGSYILILFWLKNEFVCMMWEKYVTQTRR